MKSLALRIATYEGSAFIARFDPSGEIDGITYGIIHIIGFSQEVKQHVELRGKACMPEPEGRIIVSANPYDMIQTEDETFPIYPYEVIHTVEEIDIDTILNK